MPFIPVIIAALSGAFVGSQIDDAVESPTTQNTSDKANITTFDFVKLGGLALGGLLLYSIARKNGLIK